MMFPGVDNKTVVITGCSTGIGLSTAHLMKQAGWNVIATARKAADVENLARQGFHAVALDISDADAVAGAETRIRELAGERIGALVNNAGFGQVGAVEDLTRGLLRHQFEVNVIGMQDLTNRLIPLMRRQGYGRIVNVSSVLGRISLPFMGAYSATKFAMEALSDALRVELRGAGIAVSLIEPGPIATAFRENAANRARETLTAETTSHLDYYQREIKRRELQNLNPDPFTLGPDAVARKIRHALTSRRPRIRYKVTVPAYAGAVLARLAPDALLDWIMARQTR